MNHHQEPTSAHDERPSVGLIGVGLLGTAMAERLLGAGFAVRGYDVSSERLAPFQAQGGLPAAGPGDVAAHCRRILLSLPNSDVAQAVIEQMFDALEPGHIVIDTTTGAPADAVAIGRRLATRQVDYLDATISGSSEQVRRCDAVVMAGGPAKAFQECADLFAPLARQAFHLGPWGSGSRMKLVTNLVLGLNRAALAEGLALAQSLDLDGEQTLAVLRASAAYSRIMDSKGEKMLRGDFTPQARLSQHLKDVRLMLAAARDAGMELPLSQTHRALLERAESCGWGDLDNSAILRVYLPGAGQGDRHMVQAETARKTSPSPEDRTA